MPSNKPEQTVARKTSLLLAGFISSGLISLLCFGCAAKPPLQKEPASGAVSSEEASADAKLGALSKKGETEAEKQLRLLEEEDENEKTLADLQRREREEEERRLHRRVTEDQILAGQT